MHDGFGSLGEILVVKREPPEVLQPGEGELHAPPLGQHGEPGRAVVGPEDDFKVPSETVGHPVPEPSAVASVSEYPPQSREPAVKPFDDRHRPLAVVDAGPVDGDRQREVERVDQHVLLPASHLLVSVCPLAGRVGVVRGLDAPGVNDSKAGALIAARRLTGDGVQGVHYVLDHTLELPLAEVIVHGLPRDEVTGEHTPLARCLDYVKYRVHYPEERMFPLPFLRVYDFFYNLPLIISEVGMNTSS